MIRSDNGSKFQRSLTIATVKCRYMPKFNISVILLINQSKELVISIFLVLCLKGAQNSP